MEVGTPDCERLAGVQDHISSEGQGRWRLASLRVFAYHRPHLW